MNYIHIVAVDQVNAIGKDNTIPWHSRVDMQHFKQTTTGQVLIMGRKTYESLPPSKLPNRKLIIVSKTMREDAVVGHGYVVRSIREALNAAAKIAKIDHRENVYIIGGAEIYQATAQYVNGVILSKIDTYVIDADAHYPLNITDKMNLVDTYPLDADVTEPTVKVYYYRS